MSDLDDVLRWDWDNPNVAFVAGDITDEPPERTAALLNAAVAEVRALTARLDTAEADLLMVLDVWPEARPLLDAAHRAEIRAATTDPTPETDEDDDG